MYICIYIYRDTLYTIYIERERAAGLFAARPILKTGSNRPKLVLQCTSSGPGEIKLTNIKRHNGPPKELKPQSLEPTPKPPMPEDSMPATRMCPAGWTLTLPPCHAPPGFALREILLPSRESRSHDRIWLRRFDLTQSCVRRIRAWASALSRLAVTLASWFR